MCFMIHEILKYENIFILKEKMGKQYSQTLWSPPTMFGLNNILFNKSQNMLWKYIVEIGSDIKLWGLLWSFS